MKYLALIKILMVLFLSLQALASEDSVPRYINVYPYHYSEYTDSYKKGNRHFIGEMFDIGGYKDIVSIKSVNNNFNKLLAISNSTKNEKTIGFIESESLKRSARLISGISEINEELKSFKRLGGEGFVVPSYIDEIYYVECLRDKFQLCAAYFVDEVKDPESRVFLKFEGRHDKRGNSKGRNTHAQHSFIYFSGNLHRLKNSLEKFKDNKRIKYIEKTIEILMELREKVRNIKAISKVNSNNQKKKEYLLFDFQGFLTLANKKFVVIDPPQREGVPAAVIKEINHLIGFLDQAKEAKDMDKYLSRVVNGHLLVRFLIEAVLDKNSLPVLQNLNKYTFDEFASLAKEVEQLQNNKDFKFNVDDVYRDGNTRQKFIKYMARKLFKNQL